MLRLHFTRHPSVLPKFRHRVAGRRKIARRGHFETRHARVSEGWSAENRPISRKLHNSVIDPCPTDTRPIFWRCPFDTSVFGKMHFDSYRPYGHMYCASRLQGVVIASTCLFHLPFTHSTRRWNKEILRVDDLAVLSFLLLPSSLLGLSLIL